MISALRRFPFRAKGDSTHFFNHSEAGSCGTESRTIKILTLAAKLRCPRGRPPSLRHGCRRVDFSHDGWMNLFVANIDMERYSIYQNNHDQTFDDLAGPSGIGQATRLMSGSV
jgi:hypothetical protein